MNEMEKTAQFFSMTNAYEPQLSQWMTHQLCQWANSVEVDCLGNIIAFYESESENAPTILLMSYLDTSALVSMGSSATGELYTAPYGGITDQMLQRLPVTYGKNIPIKARIVTDSEEKIAARYRLQTSFSTAEEALEAFSVGTFLTLAEAPAIMERRIACHGVADRMGAMALLMTAARLKEKKLSANVVIGFVNRHYFEHRSEYQLRTRFTPDSTILIENKKISGTEPIMVLHSPGYTLTQQLNAHLRESAHRTGVSLRYTMDPPEGTGAYLAEKVCGQQAVLVVPFEELEGCCTGDYDALVKMADLLTQACI